VPNPPEELSLPTFSARLVGRLIVFVCRAGLDIADDDWRKYIDWLKALQQVSPELKILTAPGGRAPSSAQRSLINRELDTDAMRLAVLLSDPKLVAVVRVTSWFMRSAEPFRADELEKALAYLGEGDVDRVTRVIRELGGAPVQAVRKSR
jgi:hypothetical protein